MDGTELPTTLFANRWRWTGNDPQVSDGAAWFQIVFELVVSRFRSEYNVLHHGTDVDFPPEEP